MSAWRAALWLALVAPFACSTTPSQTWTLPDAGPAITYSGCASGGSKCGGVCCPAGTNCVSGACQYPYDSAHLYVYLCPSFDSGNCHASFFTLDRMCSAITAPEPGSCYDTGFEVAPQRSYALASCTACGSGCGSPGSFRTPSGFVQPNYYSGVTSSCGTPCIAPTDCGGPVDAASGLPRCTSADCWLDALTLHEDGAELTLVRVPQAAPPAAASSGADRPRISRLNGVDLGTSPPQPAPSLTLQASVQVDFDFTFEDPTGCTPSLCFSLPSCPAGARCSTGSKTVCTRAKHDGALRGDVVRTLGFRAEPADAASPAELSLQVQLIAGPNDPATGSCRDAIDESDPQHPSFVSDVLVADALQLTALITGPNGSVTPSDAGVPNRAADAAMDGASAADAAASDASDSVCCCDFRTSDDLWHCTHSSRTNALCAVPWPACCSQDYTVCE